MKKAYKIAYAGSVEELETRVNTRMQSGWAPVGSITIKKKGFFGQPEYLQALVKEWDDE